MAVAQAVAAHAASQQMNMMGNHSHPGAPGLVWDWEGWREEGRKGGREGGRERERGQIRDIIERDRKWERPGVGYGVGHSVDMV